MVKCMSRHLFSTVYQYHRNLCVGEILTYVDMWDIPHDPTGCIRLAAMFYVVPIATDAEAIVHMGLHAILGCSTGSNRPCILVEFVHVYWDIMAKIIIIQYIQTMFIVASLHYRSGSTSVFGWTKL
eukprot:4488317-Pleurochrysis_carterae.AAC.1